MGCGTKPCDLTGVQLELAQHDFVFLEPATPIWPITRRIVKARVFEVLTVDGCLRPQLEVCVVGALAVDRLVVGLPPLEHFDLALESIAVFGHNLEVSVAKIDLIFCPSRDMHQVKVMVINRLPGVNYLAS